MAGNEVKYAHFVITLFNLALWDSDKNAAPTRTRQWLEKRCALFERYCLPSMIGQRRAGNIKWLVLFDSATPRDVRDRISRWRDRCPFMQPLFFSAEEVRGFTGRAEDRRVDFLTSAIKSCLDGNEQWILTTNLDNDDSIACDALARIRAAFEASPATEVISLINGWQLLERHRMVLAMSYPHNHFLTLAEPASPGFSTIESMSHRRARKRFPVIDIKGEPGWLEVVHNANVSNELRITSRISYKMLWGRIDLRRFGIAETFSAGHQLATNAMFPALFLKVGAWRLKRKLFNR